MEENEKSQQDGRAENNKRELPQQEDDKSKKKPKLVQDCHNEVKIEILIIWDDNPLEKSKDSGFFADLDTVSWLTRIFGF